MEQNHHRVLILGATGQIGALLVPVLAQRGHFIIAMSRNKHNLFENEVSAGKVECVQGDIFDDELLKKLIPKVDTVIGMARISPRQEYAKKICNVIKSLPQEKRPRYIHFAGAGILSTGEKSLVRDGWLFWLFSTKERQGYTEEHFQTWEYLKTDANDVEWVLLCPPLVTDKPSSKGYKVAADVPAGFLAWGVKNADVVAYVADEIEKPRPSDFNHKRVGISSQ
eukprot:TRINITY_DN15668_c0_g1_i1.p2 TRINITY_DN15668_c0_g1~~TRINITY_DN15668_c0_g1_i1.p2  ORF type:complete len:224 (-),score=43.09 TRINITY_DN15668_c0_g1_i1:15-686(-)